MTRSQKLISSVLLILTVGVFMYGWLTPLQHNYITSYILNSRRKAGAELETHLTPHAMRKFQDSLQYQWMRDQVTEDLSHHGCLGRGCIAGTFARANTPGNKLVRIRIKDHNVYVRKPFDLFVKSRTKMDRSLIVLLNVLEDMCARRLLPDVDFVLSCQDRPEKTGRMKAKPYPIFAFAKDTTDAFEKGLILIPDFENIVMAYQKMPDLYNKAKILELFHVEQLPILFRGGDSDVTGFRHRVVEYGREKDFIDAEIVTHNTNRVKSMSISDQAKYTYNLSIDGVTATWTRVVWLLATNTLMIKHKSPRDQWFYKGIRPGVHYVEVGDDVQELDRIYHALEADKARVTKMIRSGQDFYRDNLQMPGIYGYMYVLLQAYHRKQYRPGKPIILTQKDVHYGLWKRSKAMEPTNSKKIYKILTNDEWASFQQSGTYKGSQLDLGDGFIHMSYKEQVARIRAKFFAGRDDIVLVHINQENLHEGTLRPEKNRSGTDVFPHIYGEIPLSAVIKVERLT